MLDITLRNVSCTEGRTELREVTCEFLRGTHTALAGSRGSGTGTLARVIAGDVHPTAGDVVFGTRRVNALRRSRRPLLYVTAELEVPLRWSVAHLLVASVQHRGLDREDRQQEIEFVVSKWSLEGVMEAKLRELSPGERLVAQLASIEILRPGVLVADRLFDRADPAERDRLVAQFHRTLRVIGTTFITAPCSTSEIAHCDAIVVLHDGTVAQRGAVQEVYRHPINEAAARATGEVSVIPIEIRAGTVESAIGSWSSSAFEGRGVALCRPEHFTVAKKGEESDAIVAIEEAWFDAGRWMATGNVSGAVPLQFVLPAGVEVTRGRLLPLRYDPENFTLLERDVAMPGGSRVPTDFLPSRADSR